LIPVLDVQGLRKSIGGRVLLDGVSFAVGEGEKVGLIGRNGSGKSTLLHILAGLEGQDEGVVSVRKGLRVGLLAQDPELDPERTIFEAAREGRAGLREEEWDVEHRVESVLTRLGIEGWERKLGNLSGGERRRVALARTLLAEPEMLLLDEPTNHLDADTVLWLEESLFDFPGSVVVVTHDRYFLDRVVDRIVEVVGGQITSYDGGYTEYLEARAEREARERIEEGKRLRFLKKELEWARRSPPARTGKQKARRARATELSREQRANERERERERTIQLEMGEGPRLGSRILELDEVTKGYDGKILVREFSDRVLKGERIGVVGPNGAGKSTLLRLLTGAEAPDRGRVILGENTRVGILEQDRPIDPALSVERAVSDSDWVEWRGRRLHLRAYLERFLFPPEVHRQPVGSLSGGERSRLLLARILLGDFNLLILDEPTNDLDLDTLRVLEDALESFDGCLVVVTHDRYLLDRLASALWIFRGDGEVHRHHGSWDGYLVRDRADRAEREAREREEERKRREERTAAARARAREGRADRKQLTFRERRELEGMEGRIGQMEEEKQELEARLADPGFYQERPERIGETTTRYREVEEELAQLYRRWLELEDRS